MDLLTIISFSAVLIGSAFLHIPTYAALTAGLLLFLLYGHYRGLSLKALISCCMKGVRTIGEILILMAIIGVLTALWRASGCIPVIVCYAAGFIHPSVILLMTFLLNSLVSYLTGTSFGTAATMGVICANIGFSIGISPLWMGGSVLSGIFFGDRCSPVSGSAHLVCSITDTNIYDNVHAMFRSALIPFLLTCVIYLIAGILLTKSGTAVDVAPMFYQGFRIHPVCLLPAVSILILTCLKLNVKRVMGISILLSAAIALTVQHMSLPVLLRTAILGYESQIPELVPLINGGGLLSMCSVCAVVFVAACYSGIFEATGLLDFLQEFANRLSEQTTSFIAVLVLALVTCMISCNQSLTILLTTQLSAGMHLDKETLALYLEDTTMLVATLIPWSIACTVPLATIGVAKGALFFACYLYLIPLIGILRSILQKYRKQIA